jgi:hypothetical protein
MEADSWPFEQSRNCAVVTTREIMEREETILLVSHDLEDHAWQFIGPTGGTLENARIILLQEAVELDPTVLELSDLPVGWQAVRQSRGDVWVRQRCPN